jgi:spore coat protein U-like protein
MHLSPSSRGQGENSMRKLANGCCSAFFAIALAAGAAETSVDVRANIKGTCVIDLATAIDFGDLEQGTTAADRTAPGSVRYWCSKGLVYTVTLGNGNNPSGTQRRMKGLAITNSTEFLAYNLTSDAPPTGTGAGPAALVTVALTASVRGADYNALSVGQFMDTVVVTIAP